MTIAILSVVLRSTSARAPVLRATIRFWISVESLKRPPTLFTMPSSFNSSSMLAPFEQGTQNRPHRRQRGFEVVVDYLVIVFPCPGQFGPRVLEPFLDRLFRLGPALAQASLEGRQVGRMQEDRHRV